jgi:hypothetical protein
MLLFSFLIVILEMSILKYEKNMKKILVLIAISLFFIGCDEDPVKPVEETPYLPTGFTLTLNDSVYLFCNNGQLDHIKGDTIRMDWYSGEKNFNIDLLDKDDNVLKDPNPLVYTTYAKVWKHSTKEDERAFASTVNFFLSITPHDEGIANFVFELKKEGETVFKVDSIPVIIYR